jgi:hypothetical protein
LHRPRQDGGFGPISQTVDELRARFDAYEFHDERPSVQAPLLLELLELYRTKKLLRRGSVRALCDICPNAESCWDKANDGQRRAPREPTTPESEDSENGGIFLPWVGPQYKRGGVVIIGINLNITGDGETDLLIEHAITWQRYVGRFRLGVGGEGGSRYGVATAQSAQALVAWTTGRKVPAAAAPGSQLIDAVLQTSRLQAVKCVPRRSRSEPFPQMWDHCPSFLLRDELDILEPAALLVLGQKTHQAVRALPGFQPKTHRRHFPHGQLKGAGWMADVFELPHPSRTAEAPSAEMALRDWLRRNRRS